MSRLTFIAHTARGIEKVAAFKNFDTAHEFKTRLNNMGIQAEEVKSHIARGIVLKAGLPAVAEAKFAAHSIY